NSEESPLQGFAAALAVLITGASQSRQHGKSEPDLTSHLPRACLMLAQAGFPSSLRQIYESLRCFGKITRMLHRTLTLLLVFTICKQQIHLDSVLMRFIDDLLALDSIVYFGFSDQRLEQTATFSIPTSSE
ncbi:hypothetical protein Tco_0961326, partial [Tanacetum coccineum]